jgi:hypothetical protein
MTWTITIPYLVPSQNVRERQHWRVQRRDIATVAIMLRGHGAKIPKATGRRLVTITSYRRQRIRDSANLVGGCKGLNDAMVRAELLVDDCDRFATFTYRQHILSEMPDDLARKYGRRPVTVIEIQDVSPAG